MRKGPSEPSSSLPLAPNRTMRRLVHEALSRLGQDPEQVHNDAMRLSGGVGLQYQDQAPMFWNRVAGLLGDVNAGLHLAEAAPIRLLDEVLLMMYLSLDLRSALHRLVHFQCLLSGAFNASLQAPCGSSEAALVVDLDYPGFGVLRQQAECVTLMLTRLLAVCTDGEFRPTGVDLRHRLPPDRSEHLRLYGMVPRFGQCHDRLRFPAYLLDLPLPASNPELAVVMERRAEEHLRALDANQFLYQVRFWIDSHLDCPNIQIGNCANDFGLSHIALRRALGARDVQFSALLDECRKQRASTMLARGESAPVTAWACGYADENAFEQAFLGWFGCLPARFSPPARRTEEGEQS